MGYVGALGRKLISARDYNLSAQTNNRFSGLDLYENASNSSYHALQIKYQRQMAHGLQALASYTWAHAIDSGSESNDGDAFPLQKGNSDHDVRHNFTAAAVYFLPSGYNNVLEKAILGHWNANILFIARTAFPWEPTGPNVNDPVSGNVITAELNWNGKNPYVYKPGIPGGRQVDPSVFSVTSSPLGVGSLPRNLLRGFGEAQANVAIERTFPLFDTTNLQFRAEAFNLANHPTFGLISTACTSTAANAPCSNPIMGQATSTLNTGLGNLSSLYQQGGPRSLEFMLKLQF